jgi:nucleoside-diphosphate-sugar epimerase
MEADGARLRFRNAYNVTAMSVTPAEIAQEITKHIPQFAIDYQVDPVRQAIAESWPRSLDDAAARADWGWSPEFDLAAMTTDMLEQVGSRIGGARAG